MTQGRFDIPPSDPFFWNDGPFGQEIERKRIEAEQENEKQSEQ